jgi:hypothetical protein
MESDVSFDTRLALYKSGYLIIIGSGFARTPVTEGQMLPPEKSGANPMAAYRPATAHSNSITRPNCLKCHHIEVAVGKAAGNANL